MKIQKYVNSVAAENTYLLTNEGGQLLIDPGSDLAYLSDLTELGAVLLTHAHFDHIMGLQAIREKFPDLPIWLAEDEKDWPQEPAFNCSSMMLGRPITTPSATNFYQFDDSVEISGFQLKIRATPGHSIGSVSLIFSAEKVVFTGDALFKGSIGRTDLPTGDFDQLMGSIKNQLFTLPDSYKIYPGHGPHSSIGEEKSLNPFFADF